MMIKFANKWNHWIGHEKTFPLMPCLFYDVKSIRIISYFVCKNRAVFLTDH